MMKTAVKLLDQNLMTRNTCQWVIGEWKQTSGEGELCSPGWLHAYASLGPALFLNPIHANIRNPVCYRVEVGGRHLSEAGLKEGYTRMRLLHRIAIRYEEVSVLHRARMAAGLVAYAGVEHVYACGFTNAEVENRARNEWQQWVRAWINGFQDMGGDAVGLSYAMPLAEVARRVTAYYQAAEWAWRNYYETEIAHLTARLCTQAVHRMGAVPGLFQEMAVWALSTDPWEDRPQPARRRRV